MARHGCAKNEWSNIKQFYSRLWQFVLRILFLRLSRQTDTIPVMHPHAKCKMQPVQDCVVIYLLFLRKQWQSAEFYHTFAFLARLYYVKVRLLLPWQISTFGQNFISKSKENAKEVLRDWFQKKRIGKIAKPDNHSILD